MATKWFEIGTQLNVPHSVLKQVERQHNECTRLLTEVISYWIKNAPKDDISWESIITALETPNYVEEPGLARELREFVQSHRSNGQLPSHG